MLARAEGVALVAILGSFCSADLVPAVMAAQCVAAPYDCRPVNFIFSPVWGTWHSKVTSNSSVISNPSNCFTWLLNSRKPSGPGATRNLYVFPSNLIAMTGFTGRILVGVIEFFQSGKVDSQNLHRFSSFLPADCSCHLARHLRCTARGHLHGCWSVCSALSPSKHIQQTSLFISSTARLILVSSISP